MSSSPPKVPVAVPVAAALRRSVPCGAAAAVESACRDADRRREGGEITVGAEGDVDATPTNNGASARPEHVS